VGCGIGSIYISFKSRSGSRTGGQIITDPVGFARTLFGLGTKICCQTRKYDKSLKILKY
jgi:hypothetical protein